MNFVHSPAVDGSLQRLEPQPLRRGARFTAPLLLVRLVFLVVAVEERPLQIAFGRKNVGRDAVEEPAVVRDHEHAAGEKTRPD